MTGRLGQTGSPQASKALLTVPNVLSMARIVLIPVFVLLIVHRPTTFSGLVLFAVVVATDWVDGAIARRIGQVSELGKILDPTADRLAIAAGLVALVVRGAFPLWAALLVLVRDGLVLGVASAAIFMRQVRIDVRTVGKVATFGVLLAIGSISWGTLGYAFATGFLAFGWTCFGVGILEYYVAMGLYVGDLRRALAARGADVSGPARA